MIDTFVSDILASGWLFNNCYQIDAHLWRVNLRRPVSDGDYFSDWAEGETFVEALEICMTKLAEAEFTEAHIQAYGFEPAKSKINPQALLKSLGLTKPQPFTRRV